MGNRMKIKVLVFFMKVHNTLTGKLEEFEPRLPPHVSMYVCGPTVYDDSHIGHGRTYISYDMMVRYLTYKGFQVTYVRNITDIDDKIIHKANQEKTTIDVVSAKFAKSFHNDLKILGLNPPNIEPKATETVAEMMVMIQQLIDNKHAYVSNGDVYFHVKSFKEYGKLSRKNIDDLITGARVDPGELKKDPLDFALWKTAKEGEPSWLSPWGKGRPGWHIECSAMSKKHLGETIDIHTGGRDLIFPHHENELAQSECANGKTFVKYWMHNGFVNLSKEKMSKSLGNTIFLKDLFKKFHPEALKFYILSSHYRSPIDFSYDDLKVSSGALDRMVRILNSIPHKEFTKPTALQQSYIEKFEAAMDEDFNTPKAFAVLFDIVREANKLSVKKETFDQAIELRHVLWTLGNRVFGMFNYEPKDYFTSVPGMESLDVAKIETMLVKRQEARRNKDFASADQIRDDFAAMGIALEDAPEGTSWRKK
jgi:cysteinyl-tRNA synthetase